MLEVRNNGSRTSERHEAQLLPYLTVWIEDDGLACERTIPLNMDNRLLINPDETWQHEVDLGKELSLQPGSYTIAVGHHNMIVEDLGDWTGTLRSEPLEIRIVQNAC